MVKKAVVILEQNQIAMNQSSFAEHRQGLDPKPPRHPVENVIQPARVLSLPYDQCAIRTLVDLPTQLPIVFPRAIPRWHELEEEAFDALHPVRKKQIDPVHVAAAKKEALDAVHPRSRNVREPPVVMEPRVLLCRRSRIDWPQATT